MGDKTGISWTDASWNPIRGCTRVSEGCRHCYAEAVAARFSGPGQPYEGLATRKLKVISDDEQRTEPRWTGEVRFVAEHLADPLRWRRPRRIFVNSMSDLFHERLTNEQIAAVFGVMAAAPQHTFQVLTKRPKRMREWFEWLANAVDPFPAGALDLLDEEATARLGGICHLNLMAKCKWPLPNVWIGTSIENRSVLHRLDDLRACPAALRFVSAEPLLDHLGDMNLSGIDWVIAGCESGDGARPCDVEWLRSLRDRCASAGVPFFLKQAQETKLGVCGDSDNPNGDRPCRKPVTAYVISPDTAAYSCGCTFEGSELGDGVALGAGEGSKRKPRGVIELPYLDGVQHAAFPEVKL